MFDLTLFAVSTSGTGDPWGVVAIVGLATLWSVSLVWTCAAVFPAHEDERL